MMHYSIEPKEWIFVKGDGFLSLGNTAINLDHAKHSATDAT